jgi:hypothetical protein
MMKVEENRKTEGANQWTISEDKIQTLETQKQTTINKDRQNTKIYKYTWTTRTPDESAVFFCNLSSSWAIIITKKKGCYCHRQNLLQETITNKPSRCHSRSSTQWTSTPGSELWIALNEQYLRTKYKPWKHRNKQQLTKTDKTQKFTNTHEQHELPMNREWTQVLRNRKLFMSIAIHPPANGLVHGQVPYGSNPVMGEHESILHLLCFISILYLLSIILILVNRGCQ